MDNTKKEYVSIMVKNGFVDSVVMKIWQIENASSQKTEENDYQYVEKI